MDKKNMNSLSSYKNINMHLLTINNNYYAFDIEELIPIKIDLQTFRLLSQIKKIGIDKININEDEINLLNQFIDNGLLFKKYDEIQMKLSIPYNIGRVSFPTIHNCNFNCKYCFAQGSNNYNEEIKEIKEDMLHKILEFLYSEYFSQYKTIRFDFVSGGEPLLNFNLIKLLVKLSKNYNKKYSKNSYIWMCSNGYLLNDSILEYLDFNKIGLGISFDGVKDYHDGQRILKNGEPTYNIIFNKIKQITENEKLSAFTKDFWGLCVITSKIKSIIEIVENVMAIKIKNYQMKLSRLKANNELAITNRNIDQLKTIYTDFSQYLKDKIGAGNFDPLFLILNDYDVFGKLILRLLLQIKNIRRCGAGITKISICANGDIYPCDSFVGKKEFRIGNINNTDYNNLALSEKNTIYSSKDCNKCWLRYLCGGDCFHNAYLWTSNINKPDEVFCAMNNHLVILAIDIINKITELNTFQQNTIYKYASIKYASITGGIIES